MDKLKKRIIHSLCLITLGMGCFAMQGCVSAAFSSAKMFYNRQDYMEDYSDQIISIMASNRISRDPELQKNTNIAVATFKQRILLSGQAATPELRQEVINTVKKVPNIKLIVNYITIAPPASLVQQSQDSWITTKVRSKIIATNGINPKNYKVTTENNIVYLMGAAPKEQAEKVVKLAQDTTGVDKVVRLIYYVYYGTS